MGEKWTGAVIPMSSGPSIEAGRCLLLTGDFLKNGAGKRRVYNTHFGQRHFRE
jgi:hypothetical protein